jgi:tRNA-Thr(GGU) m(6)t(6)A37 methyltransferase TsaA
VTDAITMVPIGVVRGGRTEAIDDDWDAVEAVIELDSTRYQPDALAGLADFSHAEVVYQFHLVDEAAVTTTARHPREREDWPLVGIFAQRGKSRPNRLGVTVCEVVAVEGTSVRVRGLDAIDGTPVLDVKPYMREFAPRGTTRQPEWATELMRGYWGGPDT